MQSIVGSSEREPEFNPGTLLKITLYHFLYYTLFVPGLILAILIEYYNGGTIRLFHNLMFTGPNFNVIVFF